MDDKKNFLTIQESINVQLPIAWDHYHEMSIREAVYYFLDTLSPHTARAYRGAFEMFYRKRLLSPDISLKRFATLNLEIILDEIRSRTDGSDATKQARSAAFISWTTFLQRRTGKKIRKALPSKEKSSPTFKIQRHKSTAPALSSEQRYRFLDSLKKANHRDYLVAKTALQGAKRISEVINAKIEDIDWGKNRITFLQLKSHELEKKTVITYPQNFMEELREYLQGRISGNIFISRNGKPLNQAHLWRSFVAAGKVAGIPFKVHPHALRVTAITEFMDRGYSAEDISKVSGQSLKQVIYYDKTEIEKNLTTTVSLI